MYPDQWPDWVREALPLLVGLTIVIWVAMNRYFDAINKTDSGPIAHKRPTAPYIIVMASFVLAAYSQMFLPHAASAISHVHPLIKAIIAFIFTLSLILTVGSRFAKTEWWSVGLELSSSLMLSVTCVVFGYSYLTLGPVASTFGSFVSFGFALASAVRSMQLLRLIGN